MGREKRDGGWGVGGLGLTQILREMIEHDSNKNKNVETLCESFNNIGSAELQVGL